MRSAKPVKRTASFFKIRRIRAFRSSRFIRAIPFTRFELAFITAPSG